MKRPSASHPSQRELLWVASAELSADYFKRMGPLQDRYGERALLEFTLIMLKRLDYTAPMEMRNLAGYVDVPRIIPVMSREEVIHRALVSANESEDCNYSEEFTQALAVGERVVEELQVWVTIWEKAIMALHRGEQSIARAYLVRDFPKEERKDHLRASAMLLHILLRPAFPEGEDWVDTLRIEPTPTPSAGLDGARMDENRYVLAADVRMRGIKPLASRERKR